MRLNGRQHLLWLACLLSSTGLLAGDFVAPAEGPVAFRRDQIPLDVSAITEMSRHLVLLARGAHVKNAGDRRWAAQMLALALALDPANADARAALTEYQENRRRPNEYHAQQQSSRTWILPYIAWLESAPAGRHAQALAACLKDVMMHFEAPDAETDGRREVGEQGAWAAWVPSISAYESKITPDGDPQQAPAPGTSPEPQRALRLHKAQVHTLLWQKVTNDASTLWQLAAAPLDMSAGQMSGNTHNSLPPFAISIGGHQAGNSFVPMNAVLCNLLQHTHQSLPRGWLILITSSELEQSIESHKLQSISAAAAVLASAAISGREPEGIIIGQIDTAGNFKLPTGFWEHVQALGKGKGKGQRVILPTEGADFLPSILALENPGFFLEYEVLHAANFNELLDLSAKQPAENLAKTIATFREIRERIGTQDIRSYIGNRFVRQRLADILQSTRSHDSAKMLLLQASGSRPTLIPRAILAAELRRAIDPMNWIANKATFIVEPPADNLPSNPNIIQTLSVSDLSKFNQIADHCRSKVDRIDRYAGKNDRELIDHTRKLIGGIRSIEKASWMRSSPSGFANTMQMACGNWLRLHTELNELLSRESTLPPSRAQP